MDLIKTGQKIALHFKKENSMVEMICKVESADNDRLILNPPQYFMRYVEFLQVGCPLTAKVFSKLGTIDFNSVVISSPLEDCFEIELDYNSIRLKENSEIPVISAVENLEVRRGNEVYKLKTFEISTEYFKFYSDKEFTVDETLEFTIFLPKEYGIINFKGIITEIDPIYENEYTANYITITEKDKQDLLYYMYVYNSDVE